MLANLCACLTNIHFRNQQIRVDAEATARQDAGQTALSREAIPDIVEPRSEENMLGATGEGASDEAESCNLSATPCRQPVLTA